MKFAIFVIIVLLLIPFVSSQEIIQEIGSDEIEAEDILLNVDSYQPTVVNTEALERTNYPVYALLSGTKTNPFIDIPEIDSVGSFRVISGDKSLIQGTPQYRSPPKSDYSLSNMGYLIIRLKKFPQEDKVPDNIDFVLEAKIRYRVNSGFGIFEQDLNLKPQTEEQFLGDRSRNDFWSGLGYIRLDKIENGKGTFVIYDSDLRKIREISLNAGEETNDMILRTRYLDQEDLRFRDRLRLRFNNIRNAQQNAKLNLVVNGKLKMVDAVVGQAVYPGSSWKVDKITRTTEGETVILKKKEFFGLGSETLELYRNKKDVFNCADLSIENCKNSVKCVLDESNNCVERIGVTGASGSIVQVPQNELDAKNAFNNILQQHIIQFSKEDDRYRDYGSVNAGIVKGYLDIIKNLNYPQRWRALAFRALGPSGSVENTIINEGIYDFFVRVGDDTNRKALLTELQKIDFDKSVYEKKEVSAETLDYKQYYEKAIESYQYVIDSFPDVEDKNGMPIAYNAQKRIAEIYESVLFDNDKAADAYKKLITDYDYLDEVKTNIDRYTRLINFLEQRINYDINTKEFSEKGNSFKVSIDRVDEQTQKARAVINVNGNEQSLYIGDKIGQSEWYIDFISNDKVRIIRETSDGKQETKILELNKQQAIAGISLTLLNTETNEEAYVTILPGSKKLISTTTFKIHIPVEKRTFKLSKEQIDSHIASTDNLINKLNNVIDATETVHKGFTFACYGTFTGLFLKNLFLQTPELIARKSVIDNWEKNYCNDNIKAAKEKGYKNIGECIEDNADAIEEDIKNAENSIKNADRIVETEDFPSEYKDYEDYLKNHPNDKDSVKEVLRKEELAKMQWKEGILVPSTQKDAEESKKNLLIYQDAENGVKDIVDKYNNDINLNKCEGVIRTLDPELSDTNCDNLQTAISNAQASKLKANLKKYGITNQNQVVSLEEIKKSEGNTININTIRTDSDGYLYVVDSSSSTKSYDLYEQKDGASKRVLTSDPEKKKTILDPGKLYYYKSSSGETIQSTVLTTTSLKAQSVPYERIVTLEFIGRNEGRLERLSIDPYYYFEIKSRNGAGLIQDVTICKKIKHTDKMGLGGQCYDTGFEISQCKNQIELYKTNKVYDEAYKDNWNNPCNELSKIDSDINRNLGTYKEGSRIGGAKGYFVDTPILEKDGPSCFDVMSPNDCRLLFGACDPVMCPSSRFDLDGKWHVNNVIQTGIAGSLILGAHNFDLPYEPVPICVTGVVAGLKNWDSILQGYRDCLERQKETGESIGSCSYIRNLGVCQTLWETSSVVWQNYGDDILNRVTGIGGNDNGGEEYITDFAGNIQRSEDFLKFFTSEYSQSVFAAYRGASSQEIGTDICKAAIFQKLPGQGNIVDQLLKPSVPPQFTALFTESQHSDVTGQRLSDYSVYYHVYAGEDPNGIRYVVYLRNEKGQQLPITRTVKYLEPGKYDDITEFIASKERGFKEVCVRITGYGEQCGFGKVSTGFALSYLQEEYVKNEASKRDIKTAGECLSDEATLVDDPDLAKAPIQFISEGLTKTGILRRCSQFDPDGQTGKDNWISVGSCGQDNNARDLGQCWLDRESLNKALIQEANRIEAGAELPKGLEDTQDDISVQKQIDDLNKRLSDNIEDGSLYLFNLRQAKTQDELKLKEEKTKDSAENLESNFKSLINEYNDLIDKTVKDKLLAQIYFKLGESYQNFGLFLEQKNALSSIGLSSEVSDENQEFDCAVSYNFDNNLENILSQIGQAGATIYNKMDFKFVKGTDNEFGCPTTNIGGCPTVPRDQWTWKENEDIGFVLVDRCKIKVNTEKGILFKNEELAGIICDRFVNDDEIRYSVNKGISYLVQTANPKDDYLEVYRGPEVSERKKIDKETLKRNGEKAIYDACNELKKNAKPIKVDNQEDQIQITYIKEVSIGIARIYAGLIRLRDYLQDRNLDNIPSEIEKIKEDTISVKQKIDAIDPGFVCTEADDLNVVIGKIDESVGEIEDVQNLFDIDTLQYLQDNYQYDGTAEIQNVKSNLEDSKNKINDVTTTSSCPLAPIQYRLDKSLIEAEIYLKNEGYPRKVSIVRTINGKKTTVLEDFDCRQQKSIAKINGYTDLINNYLNKNPVHPEITPPIIKSFIALESNGDPLAVNGREPGGRVSAGLMQLISSTARNLGLNVPNYGTETLNKGTKDEQIVSVCRSDNLKGCDFVNDERFDTEKNLDAGIRNIKEAYERFGSLPLMIAAENAYGTVAKYCKDGGNLDSCGDSLPDSTKEHVARAINCIRVFNVAQ